jgi:aminopeptidase N
VTKRSLEFFNNYFGKRYPLPKLDMVALSRLSVGAMENWGLITCRETGLIIDPSDSTTAQLQKVATLIAHEVSHQV